MKNSLCNARGIALIQVLFLSAILMVMLLSVIHQSQRHIKSAELLLQRAEASLTLNTLQAETEFALLTQHKIADSKNELELAKKWNFHNLPVFLGDNSIQIQDLSGLGSIFHVELVLHLLSEHGVSTDNLQIIAMGLKDIVNAGGGVPLYLKKHIEIQSDSSIRNTPLQLIDELQFYPGVTSNMLEQIRPLLTAFPVTQYNYLNMPAKILAFYLQPLELQAVLDARTAGRLTANTFADLTGRSYDQSYGTSVGRGLRLRFTASTKDVKLRRQTDIVLNPYSSQPLTYWEYHKYRHVE